VTGGRHLFFRRCLGPLNPTIADGIEVKTVSVMPPSLHDETHDPYRLIERTVADSTDWLLRRAIKPPPAPKPKRTPRPAHAGPSVAEAFNKTRTWNEILTPHGWRRVDGDGEADGSLWRHPDATHEWSASIRVNADGHSRLYVYSTNTPFQATTPADPHGYDRFDASAVLDHGGDVRALCDALARDPFRQKEA
jgi:hypothetical protein